MIKKYSKEYEERIKRIPFLNLDTFVIPSPYITDYTLEKDFEHSYVWDQEGELLGYILVYSNPEKNKFHIYKQVTSPFGRGKGIGSAFLEKLVNSVGDDCLIYLYVWEKKTDSIDFFENKGFIYDDSIVYRQLIFNYMFARSGDIKEKIEQSDELNKKRNEKLGKTRHDARKILKLLLEMVNMLSISNCSKIIEDINRETHALINLLNSYEDRLDFYHREIDLKELLVERVISYIDVSTVPCEIKFHLYPRTPHVYGHYIEVGRALINIVSNSLDAIKKAGRRGIIQISLKEADNNVQLVIEDNGIGIDSDRLALTAESMPKFVGQTTKGEKSGKGIGTKQIYSTFGPENIVIESEPGRFTRWSIKMQKVKNEKNKIMLELEQRFNEFQKLYEIQTINEHSEFPELSSFIWKIRKMEIFLYDLVFQYSKYNNIRNIYRSILAFLYGNLSFHSLQEEIKKYRINEPEICGWLLEIVQKIKSGLTILDEKIALNDQIKGVLFKSYGQAQGKTIVFTMDPVKGNFFATDRKLAEHLDFVPYLDKGREFLLRGEFSGDTNETRTPIFLGVWSVVNQSDLYSKLALIKKGAAFLIRIGINKNKKLAFYHTTYNNFDQEINTYKTTTLFEMAQTDEKKLNQFVVQVDDEMQGYVFSD